MRVVKKVEKNNARMGVKAFLKQQQKYDFSHVVQRRDVWKDEARSLFITSLIMGYPVPNFFVLDETKIDGAKRNTFYMLDGKQRLTTIIRFCQNEFRLSKDTPPIEMLETNEADEEWIEEVEIAGMTFDELPQEIKDEIYDYQFDFVKLTGAESEDVQEIFFRLNSGMPLNQIEKTRALTGLEIMDFVQLVAEKPFFATSVKVAESQKNRFVDEELVLQIMMLVLDPEVHKGFSGKEIREFALELKEKGIPEEIKKTMLETTDYLGKALPDPFRFLKKVNVPMVFIHAIRAIKEGIEPEKFGGWVVIFAGKTKSGYGEYGSQMTGGTAKREKVANRLLAMARDYEANIANAPNYIKPAPAQSGRKKNNESEQGQEGQGQEQNQEQGQGQEDQGQSEDQSA